MSEIPIKEPAGPPISIGTSGNGEGTITLSPKSVPINWRDADGRLVSVSELLVRVAELERRVAELEAAGFVRAERAQCD